MPKYPKGRPYDIIRDIKDLQNEIKDLKLALSLAGISVGSQGLSGVGPAQSVSGSSGATIGP